MTRDEFHARRQMFLVLRDGPVFAEPGDPRTHWQWLKDILGVEPEYARWTNTTRGYVLDTLVVLYRGNFLPDVDPDDVLAVLGELEDRVTHVGFGAVRSTVQPWPQVRVYTLDKYLEIDFARIPT
jgi:hypothetical protein